ncbi:MAG: S9 family peptidase [Bacteroidetes bacterium]|nr:MAG: S9 family peptidase [Bacteroidota bacterium]
MKYFLLSIALFSYHLARSQEQISKANYERAIRFLPENIGSNTYNLRIGPNWFDDGTGLWFKTESTDGTKYQKLYFKDGKITELFKHETLAQLLSNALGKPIQKGNLGLDDVKYVNSKELILSIGPDKYLFNTRKNTLTPYLEARKEEIHANRSPDGRWEVYTENYNLYVRNLSTGETKALSDDGSRDYAYGSWYNWSDLMEGENADRPKHFGVEWSRNSEWIHVNICDTRNAHKMYLLDWSIDSLYRPKLLSYFRGSPGDTNMVYHHTVFFNVRTGKRVEPNLPGVTTHINPLRHTWSSKDGIVYLRYDSRGYKTVELLQLDLNTGSQTSIYKEESETNIDNFDFELLEDFNRVYFFSERSGWKQIHYVDLETKKLVDVTKGKYFINEFMHFDGQSLYFMASGVKEGVNPYYQKLYKIDLEGDHFTELTPEDLHHDLRMSEDGRYACDNISDAVTPTRTIIRDLKTGKVIAELGKADVSPLQDYRAPKLFKALARDHKTTIYGALWLPSDFDESKKYPIIDASYTGPHTHEFPVEFRYSLSSQSLAELGFIVMRVDGLGSAGRSKAFHDHSYRNLGGNLEDHILAIRQMARKYSWIDTNRVGIYGHSAGGYDAGHAVLAYPDFYKVAVASSGDHDHRMEKAWWPEMYMGWPVDSAYHKQSNVTMASNLTGKLLLVHGGIDENVNPSATFKLAEALIRADKQFDLLILPSQRHGYVGAYRKYFIKTRWNYFVEHLLDLEPIWEIEW